MERAGGGGGGGRVEKLRVRYRDIAEDREVWADPGTVHAKRVKQLTKLTPVCLFPSPDPTAFLP